MEGQQTTHQTHTPHHHHHNTKIIERERSLNVPPRPQERDRGKGKTESVYPPRERILIDGFEGPPLPAKKPSGKQEMRR